MRNCVVCHNGQHPITIDLHRKLKDFIELLKFVCPGCSEGYMYNEIQKHMSECEEAIKVKADGRKAPASGG
jgi:uncharacterized protein (DUF983 family)